MAKIWTKVRKITVSLFEKLFQKNDYFLTVTPTNTSKDISKKHANARIRKVRKMDAFLIEWFPTNQIVAALLSISLNILVAIAGVLPSAFITAGNIAYFGFEAGLIVSIAGEAAGAIVSFYLYRKGLIKLSASIKKSQSKLLLKLKQTSGIEAVMLVVALRILPFIPSGAVTLAAAYSTMRLIPFCIASTIGKIPSLFIEAYSVDHILSLKQELQIGLIPLLILMAIIYFFVKRTRSKK